jgi:hypothetical protein
VLQDVAAHAELVEPKLPEEAPEGLALHLDLRVFLGVGPCARIWRLPANPPSTLLARQGRRVNGPAVCGPTPGRPVRRLPTPSPAFWAPACLWVADARLQQLRVDLRGLEQLGDLASIRGGAGGGRSGGGRVPTG